MKKSLIAAAILSTIATQASALEIYNDDTNKLSIGGRLGVNAKFQDGDSTMENSSSRINFAFEHKLTETITTYTVAEWGFDPVSTGGESKFSNRLGLVGARHDTYGSLQVGKQWSVYSDIAMWTDQFAIGGGEAMGMYDGISGDGGVNGTGRADDAVAYRFSVGGLNVGAQYQMQDSKGSDKFENPDLGIGKNWKRKDGYQGAISYDFGFGLSVGATYNETSFEKRDNAKAVAAAVKFENERVYLAATVGEFRNHTNTMKTAGYDAVGDINGKNFDKKSSGVEAFGQYNLESISGLGIYAGYNKLDVDEAGDSTIGKDSKGKLEKAALGTVYRTGPMQFAAEYTKDNSKKHDGSDDSDNSLVLQARYYF